MKPQGPGFPLVGFTGAFTVFLLVLILHSSPHLTRSSGNSEESKEESARNERSTPRSFVLPATPAVALEQERQRREFTNGIDVFRCLGKLRELGYQSDDTPPALTARNTEAIFKFQQDHNIETTGRLNKTTIELLGCK